jgi:hypothetical protein
MGVEWTSEAEVLSPAAPRPTWFHVLTTALILTGLNAAKPVHVDDPIYLTYAFEFASHPLDPYGFETGSPYVSGANETLVPPVLPYWLGAGSLVLGREPLFLKCWLFPFALALAWAVDFLSGRFCPSLRRPVLWLTIVSPTILPGFNFMLDVPALALGLAAVATAMRSVERNSWGLVIGAGLLGGLAVQTKYTGLVQVAAMAVWYLLRGRPARGLVAVVVAAVVAVGWECVAAYVQGESHFLLHFRQRQGHAVARFLHLTLPLVGHIAGLAPVVALLGMTARGASRRTVVISGCLVVAGFAMLAVVPSQAPLLIGSKGKPILTPSNIVYGLLAIPVWGGLVGACRALGGTASANRTIDRFLLIWLVLEFAGYFALSPFPAARRVAGIVLVCTLAAGRLAHLRGVSRRAGSILACCGASLAMLFFVADFLDARASQIAVQRVIQTADPPSAGRTFWHITWGGISYHADHAGLRPVRLNRDLPQPGDRLAVLDALEDVAKKYPQLGLELIDTVTVRDAFPLKTGEGYYSGRTPLENQGDGRIRLNVYRVTGPQPPSPSISSGRTR